eukprot:SAG31_NODE_26253_length_445_cov_1.575145_1_plen_68_part_10
MYNRMARRRCPCSSWAKRQHRSVHTRRAFSSVVRPGRPALVVHGGAWAIAQENTEKTLAGIRSATLAG